VGQALALVEDVERDFNGRATNPKRQRAARVEPRLGRECDHLALDAFEVGRDGIRYALEPVRHLRPHEKQARSLQLAAVTTKPLSIRAMEGTLPKIVTSPRSPSRGPSP
jgi:hypothetical protein